jgi:ADP-ribose pyrophosphatase YjhB (NUDIX family)
MAAAHKIALWAEQLRDISAMGLRFSENIYDIENYQKLQGLALEMMALAKGVKAEDIKPVFGPLLNHPTPFAVGTAAVIDANGRILLIKRADNRKWAMPGGALAVDETPAEGVIREVQEETGLKCKPISLVGIFDSRITGSETPHHLYQLLILCETSGSTKPVKTAYHGIEVLDVRWFDEENLPENIGLGHILPIKEAYRVWRGDIRPYIDI